MEMSTLGMVRPETQLCCRMESIPMSPWRETFG